MLDANRSNIGQAVPYGSMTPKTVVARNVGARGGEAAGEYVRGKHKCEFFVLLRKESPVLILSMTLVAAYGRVL